MLQRDASPVGATQPPADLASLIQFYSIELAPIDGGRLYVGVTATICEHEGELELMEMGSGHVDTLDKALTMIRDAVAPRH
jgi:hypothetical protein